MADFVPLPPTKGVEVVPTVPLPKISSIEAVPWNVRMRAPYRSAQRITTTAHNVLVRVVLDDGSVGYGESAPAMYVTGETQDSVIEKIRITAPALLGALIPVDRILVDRILVDRILEGIETPGARGALEMAVREAFVLGNEKLRSPFQAPLKASLISQQTDLSLPLLPPDEAGLRAEQAARDGYHALKVKIGGPSMDEDEARVRAVAHAAPDTVLRLDGNQGFAPEDAVRFMERLTDLTPRIQMLEQPTKAGDDDALLFVQNHIMVPVFADEAVHDKEDAARLLYKRACKGVVLKIAKSGFNETLRIARTTVKAKGLLMFGCMMETRLAISAALQLSAAIAADYGVQPLLDLDGHLLTKADGMVSGGFTQNGDVLTFDPKTPGLGVDVVWPPPVE